MTHGCEALHFYSWLISGIFSLALINLLKKTSAQFDKITNYFKGLSTPSIGCLIIKKIMSYLHKENLFTKFRFGLCAGHLTDQEVKRVPG